MRALNPDPTALFEPAPGSFSHGVLVPEGMEMFYVSGQVGIAPDGSAPEGAAEQAEQVWRNLITVLETAGLDLGDVVKMTSYIVDEATWDAFAAQRPQRFAGRSAPASTGVYVPRLARPEWKLEVEAIAARRPA